MAQNHPSPWIIGRVAVASLLILLLGAVPVGAETQSRWDGEISTADAANLSDVPANQWGLANIDPGSEFFQYYSHALAITQIGDRLYVGGKFQDVTNGRRTESQPYLAAFDVDTGAWIESFAPDIDWSVFALAPSPGGDRLFVGGEFTTAGKAGTAAFVALDPTTGQVDESFDIQVTREWSDLAPRVHAMDVHEDWLYIGGAFSHVTGTNVRLQSSRVARISLSTGQPDVNWKPYVSGGSIWEIEASTRGDRVYLGGTHLLTQGEVTKGFSVVDTTTAQLVPGIPLDYGVTNHTHRGGIEGYVFVAAIVEVGNRVFTGGQKHNLVFAKRGNMTVLRTHQTNKWTADFGGGDFQAIAVAGDVLFASCHCWGLVHELGTDYYRPARGVLAFDVNSGDHLEDYAPEMTGADGPWALHVADDDCLWIGSDIARSGGVRTNGLIRHCPSDGPRTPVNRPLPTDVPVAPQPPVTPTGLSVAAQGGDAVLSWDPVAGAASYILYRNGTYIGWTASTTFSDTAAPAGSLSYQLRAVNNIGRSDKTDGVAITVQAGTAPATPARLRATVDGDTVTLRWRAVDGARSYLIYRNGAYVGWTSTNSAERIGVSAGDHRYEIRATNEHGRSDKTPSITVSVG